MKTRHNLLPAEILPVCAGGEQSLQTHSWDAQSRLLKASGKQDLTGSAKVFLPYHLPIADGVCNAHHMLLATPDAKLLFVQT